jgi:hypothetical protein
LIKIKEEESVNPLEKGEMGNIMVRLENKEVVTFEKYPIVFNSHVIKNVQYEVLKKQKDLNQDNEKLGLLDRAKQKALEVKDTVADTAKQKALEVKDTVADTAKELSNETKNV